MAKKKTDPISLGVPGHFVNTAKNQAETRDRNKKNKGRRFTNPVKFTG